jgi:hypothetical protein
VEQVECEGLALQLTASVVLWRLAPPSELVGGEWLLHHGPATLSPHPLDVSLGVPQRRSEQYAKRINSVSSAARTLVLRSPSP